MTTSITSVNSSTSSQTALAADGTRTSVTIQNTDANTAYISVGVTPATTAIGGFTFSRVLNASATLTPPESQNAIYVIWDGDGSGGLTITSITDPVVDDNGSISTYSELKTSLAAWLKAGTTLPSEETTSRIPEYIAMFEEEANRILRVRNMDTVSTVLTITDGSATVPTGFREARSFRNTASPYSEITYLPIDQIEALDPTNTDPPCVFDVVGANFIFWPPTSATARLRYRRGLTPLAAADDTNWLLAKHPSAYVWGSLRNADLRLVDPERVALVQPNYERVMAQIMAEDINMIGAIIRPMPSAYPV
jgi:hypothetical protein